MLKKYAFSITVMYSVILAVVSFIHISGIPEIDYSNTDKIFHFLAYSALAWFWFQTFYNAFKWTYYKSLLVAAIVSIIFGILIEVLQGVLTSTRLAENNDVLANVLGISLTVIILLSIRKTEVKK